MDTTDKNFQTLHYLDSEASIMMSTDPCNPIEVSASMHHHILRIMMPSRCDDQSTQATMELDIPIPPSEKNIYPIPIILIHTQHNQYPKYPINKNAFSWD